MRCIPQPTAEEDNSRPVRQAIGTTLLKHHMRLWPRFLSTLARLQRLPRNWRRQIARKAAVSLAGVALLFSLGRAPTLHAASITVDGSCTLVNAILSAEQDTSVGGCLTGDGADTITLTADVTLTDSYDLHYYSDTALPLITTEITIEGAGFTIARDTADPDKFRLFAVSTSGDLTLNDVTLSGGYAYYKEGSYPDYFYDGDGGVVESHGALTITDSTFENNEARESGGAITIRGDESQLTIMNTTFTGNVSRFDGGAIYTYSGEVTVLNSVFTDNETIDGGYGAGIGADRDTNLTIMNSTFTGNDADDGGGVWGNGVTTITNSIISGNSAAESGGGVRNDGEMTISNSTISGNTAEVGAGLYNDNFDVLTISNSTVSGNSAEYDGGGVYNGTLAEMTIINSTFSENLAGDNGGAIFNAFYGVMIISNSTFGENSTNDQGGAIYNDGELTISRSVISGNSAGSAGAEIHNGRSITTGHNLVGYEGVDLADAISGFSLVASDINATGDSATPYALADILDMTLAENGGPTAGAPGLEQPMLTLALVEDSPAIDAAPSAGCDDEPVFGLDQRGYVRSVDGDNTVSSNECDIGAFEFGSAPLQPIYMTAAGPGATEDGIAFGKEDILFWNGVQWSTFFDGVNEGLTAKHDLNAIHVNSDDDLYLSFFQNKIKTASLGNVFGQDILHYDGSGFSLFFDGSDVGLTTTAEKIDALHILDGSESPIGGGCDYYLLLSTLGTGKVPAFGGGQLSFQGEDVLGFCMTNTGAETAGFWHLVVDGSAEGMPKNSTDSISANADGSLIYLTTQAAFNVDNAFGGHSMVYEYDTANGEFSGPLFDAAANGLPSKVNGLHVAGGIP